MNYVGGVKLHKTLILRQKTSKKITQLSSCQQDPSHTSLQCTPNFL